MAGPSSTWEDLGTRLGSAAVMVLLGALAVMAGGFWFHLLVALVTGLMAWELGRMIAPDTASVAIQIGLLVGAVSLVVPYLPGGVALPLLVAPGMVALGLAKRMRVVGAIYTVMILLAGFGLDGLRDLHGAIWMLWLALVVIATDVLGYFAGRLIGGPKFWPRVSPKKTWSGTVAGWLGAGLVGLGFAIGLEVGIGLVGISIALAMASQLGDIGESALKRHAGIKDSSALIPGHGGLLDRFDGMIGAALLLALVQAIIVFPPPQVGIIQ